MKAGVTRQSNDAPDYKYTSVHTQESPQMFFHVEEFRRFLSSPCRPSPHLPIFLSMLFRRGF